MDKESMMKSEEFARKIVRMAKEDGLTVRELYAAADMAKGISDNSMVDVESIEKTDFPSSHIFEYPEELFTPEDSTGTKYSSESSSIVRPTASHEQGQ